MHDDDETHPIFGSSSPEDRPSDAATPPGQQYDDGYTRPIPTHDSYDSGYTPAYNPAPAQPLSPSDERLWATLIHVGGVVVGFLSPLLGYLLLKDRSAFVGENARRALDFQITVAIAGAVATVLALISFGLLFFLPLAVAVADVVFCIVAGAAAGRGEVYRYPLAIAFVR